MKFTLNGQEAEAEGSLSYEDIARLAMEFQPSVTYRIRPNGASGILTAGDRIVVSPGLTINAIRTGNA